MLVAQTRAEFLRMWRTPSFSISTIVFPVMFFAFFGLPNAGNQVAGTSAQAYLMASAAAYGVVSVMLFGFGISVAVERGMRAHVLLRATPLRPAVHLLARVLVALAFAAIMLAVLFTFGSVVGRVALAPEAWMSLALRVMPGSLPFIALGYAIGFLARPNAAPAIANLVYLPLSFASGLFIPVAFLPELLRSVAPALPSYHLGQLAWGAVGATAERPLESAAWLAAYTVALGAVALWAYRREDDREFA